MTDEDVYKQFDDILKQSIIQSLKKHKAENYAEEVFYDALVKKDIIAEREVIEMSYEDLEEKVL